MASQIKVDQLAGAAGNTVTIPAGQTLDVLGTLDIDAGTLVLPNTVVTTTGTQTLTNKTITAPKIGTSILDTNGNELALLTATGSAVNEFTIANASTGNGPTLSATGETNVDLNLSGKGTGHITVRGDTNAGAIQLNCENNTHGQQIKSQPHSTNTTNIMLLPQGANSTLVSLVSADTLTNKTLTSPKINDTTAITATGAELNLVDGSSAGTIANSKAVIYSAAGQVNGTSLAIAGTAITSTASELNILDGVTATTAELNYSDLATLGTSAASKVLTANANNLTTISGAVLNTQDTLTDQATIAWDVIASPVAFVTLGGNRTMAAPSGTGAAAGQFISLLVKQDGTGGRTITWNAVYEFPSDTAPTLTATANLGDIFSFRYNGAKWLLIGQTLALTLS